MNEVVEEAQKLADPGKAALFQRFFKTGRGEYGEGDRFLGLTVPQQRQVAKKFINKLALNDAISLLRHPFHECRFIALIILIGQAKKAPDETRRLYMEKYLENSRFVNNWDLVDVSAHRLVGEYLRDKDRAVLYRLAVSDLLWERRIAVISTFAFIRSNDLKDALAISQILLHDPHDLIHKAVGWVLREVGKKDRKAEEDFLRKYYRTMPRTMLRYAIEKFDEETRQSYLRR